MKKNPSKPRNFSVICRGLITPFLTWICWRCLEKAQHISPNGGAKWRWILWYNPKKNHQKKNIIPKGLRGVHVFPVCILDLQLDKLRIVLDKQLTCFLRHVAPSRGEGQRRCTNGLPHIRSVDVCYCFLKSILVFHTNKQKIGKEEIPYMKYMNASHVFINLELHTPCNEQREFLRTRLISQLFRRCLRWLLKILGVTGMSCWYLVNGI